MSGPYEDINKDDLTLRDVLALDRTRLANQRTLLSYARTGFSLIITALAIFQFAEKSWAHISAWALVGLGMLIIIVGFIVYFRIRKNLRKSGDRGTFGG